MTPLLLQALLGFSASLSFAMIFDLRGKTLVQASVGGGISWLLYQLFSGLSASYLLPFFLASLLSSLYAEVMARVSKKPATVFLIVAMLPLVPGQGIFETMQYFVLGDAEKAMEVGGRTLAISGTLAIGILLLSSLFKIIQQQQHKNSFPDKNS